MKVKQKAASKKRYDGFTQAEKSAMKDRVDEMKADKAEGDEVVLAKIATMSEPDRTLGKRVHAIITAAAPALTPRLWYGMPAYYMNGKLLCHFKAAEKFKTRYATIGFSDLAKLDDGDVWPTEYAVPKLTKAAESTITALVKKAAR